METIRVKRRITSSQIRISELKELIGKHVEITVTEQKTRRKRSIKQTAAGFLEHFKNVALTYKENEAWELIVNEKHGNY
jgi:hypothetical protein